VRYPALSSSTGAVSCEEHAVFRSLAGNVRKIGAVERPSGWASRHVPCFGATDSMSRMSGLCMEPTPSNAIEPASAEDRKARKKRRKLRSAWIAFVGRIVAQFVGSAATIVLGLILLHTYQPAPTGAAAVAASSGDKPVAVTTFRGHDAENSIAVLPLHSVSRGGNETAIADSMTDVVAAALADLPGLRVVSRTSGYSHGKPRALADASALPGAQYVLEGSVAQADGLFRVIVRLVDTERDEQVWASRYDRPVRNMFKMQDEIAAALARDLRAAIFDREDGIVPTTWTNPASDQLTSAIPLSK
jgi:TolB-like protein